ncbi:unnamed protein product [Effrenium voratum]|nr:unnamed protein product [Effrenium voratum]
MSRWLKHFYMTCVSTHNELQWPRHEPTFEDFRETFRFRAAKQTDPVQENKKIFGVPAGFKLPDSLKFTMSNLKTTGRKAGTLSNHTMAAATAWILNCSPNFEATSKTWTGVFLQKGFIFESASGKSCMSLGFRKWGALGTAMRRVKSGDQEALGYWVM